MDQNTLVASGHALVTALDKADFAPRVAMWVHNTDADIWKLWLVPAANVKDKHDFYRHVSLVVSQHRDKLHGIDASDTEMVRDSHPAIKGLRGFIRMPKLGSAYFTGNSFNGFYLPEGIILRQAL